MKYTLSLLLVSSAVLAGDNLSQSRKKQNNPPPFVPRRSFDSLMKEQKHHLACKTESIALKLPSAKNHSKSDSHLPSRIENTNNTLITAPPGLYLNMNTQSKTGAPPKRPPRKDKLAIGSASCENLLYAHKNYSPAHAHQSLAQSSSLNPQHKPGHRRQRSLSANAAGDINFKKTSWEQPRKNDLRIPSRRTKIREAKRSSKRFGKHRAETLSQQLFALTNVQDLFEAPAKSHSGNRNVTPTQIKQIEENQASIVELLLELENQGAKRLAILKKIENNTSKLANASDSLAFWAKEAQRLTKKVDLLLQAQATTIEQGSQQLANIKQKSQDTNNNKRGKKSKSVASFPSIKNPLSPRLRSKTNVP